MYKILLLIIPHRYYNDQVQGSALLVFSIGYQTSWGEPLVEEVHGRVLCQMLPSIFLQESWTVKPNKTLFILWHGIATYYIIVLCRMLDNFSHEKELCVNGYNMSFRLLAMGRFTGRLGGGGLNPS
jgi:hypothetical protein